MKLSLTLEGLLLLLYLCSWPPCYLAVYDSALINILINLNFHNFYNSTYTASIAWLFTICVVQDVIYHQARTRSIVTLRITLSSKLQVAQPQISVQYLDL